MTCKRYFNYETGKIVSEKQYRRIRRNPELMDLESGHKFKLLKRRMKD